ncbi:hypothetical protein ACHQM5_012389 [Ranunculus cassubicifolius]
MNLSSCLFLFLSISGPIWQTSYRGRGYASALAPTKETTENNFINGDFSNGLFYSVKANRGRRDRRPRRPASPLPNRAGHMSVPPTPPFPPPCPPEIPLS